MGEPASVRTRACAHELDLSPDAGSPLGIDVVARIRTIKPEFPQSESMGRVSRDARLLFVELWTICDDEGRSRGNSRMLASLLFPYDDDAPGLIDGWLAELEREGCIVRYSVSGSTYIQVCNWLSHQKIDRPSSSKIPAFDESSRILANPRESSSVDRGPRTVDQGPWTVDQGEARSSPSDDPPPPPEAGIPPPASPPASRSKGSRLPDDWTLPRSWGDWAMSEQPTWTHEHTRRIGETFRDYWRAKAGKDGVKLDWEATWRNWVRREKPLCAHGPPLDPSLSRLSPHGRATAEAAMRWLESTSPTGQS